MDMYGETNAAWSCVGWQLTRIQKERIDDMKQYTQVGCNAAYMRHVCEHEWYFSEYVK
jgi:hypothetical protein